MTLSVTMIANANGGTAGLLLIGQTYALPDDFARALVYERRAAWVSVDPLAVQPPQLTAAQIAAVQSLVAGAGILWANRPSAISNPGASITVTDVPIGGRTTFYSDGANWIPAGGAITLVSLTGTVASPVAQTATTGGALLMGAPVSGIKISAGLIIPGKTTIQINALWSKGGSAGGIPCNMFFGTTNSFSDNLLANQFIGAAATSMYNQMTEVGFSNTTTYNTQQILAENGAAGATATGDRTGNVNTSADMYFNFGHQSSTAPDNVALLRLMIRLFQ